MRKLYTKLRCAKQLQGRFITGYQRKQTGRPWLGCQLQIRTAAVCAARQLSSSPESAFEYDLSDFIFIASKKVGLNNSLAGGYLFRLRGTTVIHRTIQQFTIVSNYNAFRLAHRISTDQTFEPREPTTFRLRYRLTAELPLNGESVDPGEWYAKISNEYLNSLQDKSYDLEIRLIPLLGYQFTDNNKLEFGPDYRISSFLESSPRSVYWLSVNWFVKL